MTVGSPLREPSTWTGISGETSPAAGILVVGESGVIESDIHVSSIIISGEVHGNIVANKSIEIRVPGRVYGNIQAPTVTIHEGVIFEGSCRTCQVTAPEEIKLSVIRPVKKRRPR